MIESIIDHIERKRKEQDSIYHNIAVRFGLSGTALWILYVLSKSDAPCIQQDFCRQYFYPKQTIHTAIAALTKKNYVVLEAIPGTRNQKQIPLTESGRELANCTAQKLRNAEIEAYKSLSPEELDLYLRITVKITEQLRKETKEL